MVGSHLKIPLDIERISEKKEKKRGRQISFPSAGVRRVQDSRAKQLSSPKPWLDSSMPCKYYKAPDIEWKNATTVSAKQEAHPANKEHGKGNV